MDFNMKRTYLYIKQVHSAVAQYSSSSNSLLTTASSTGPGHCDGSMHSSASLRIKPSLQTQPDLHTFLQASGLFRLAHVLQQLESPSQRLKTVFLPGHGFTAPRTEEIATMANMVKISSFIFQKLFSEC